MVFLDDFTVDLAAVQEVRESFDTTARRRAAAGVARVDQRRHAGFAAPTCAAAQPAERVRVANGTSVTAARAWSTRALPADVQASAAFYPDSLIPGDAVRPRVEPRHRQPRRTTRVSVTRGLRSGSSRW